MPEGTEGNINARRLRNNIHIYLSKQYHISMLFSGKPVWQNNSTIPVDMFGSALRARTCCTTVRSDSRQNHNL